MKNFYINQDGQPKGPYTMQQLRTMWKKGAVNNTTTYCEEGGDQWRSLGMMQSLLEQDSSPTPNPPELETHGSLRLTFYWVLGIGVFLAIVILLRMLAKRAL